MRKDSQQISKKDAAALKSSSFIQSTEQQYKTLFDSMSNMVEIIELIYDEHKKPVDYYIRDVNLSFASHVNKNKNELINKKISSVMKIIEDYWLTSFASVDKTGVSISFKNYAAEFDKYYFVSAWKVSKYRVGVSYTCITEHEKTKIALKKKLEIEKKARSETEQILIQKRLEIYKASDKLNLANVKLSFQNEEKNRQADELADLKVEFAQQVYCLNEAAIVSETDAAGNILFVNDKFCEIFGYQRDELIGKNHRMLKSEKQSDAVFIDMWATISAGNVWKGEVINKEKKDHIFHSVDMTVMPFKDLNGKIIKYVAILFDITPGIEQTTQLAVANKALAIQNGEKEKRADELDIANIELAFQNKEKDERASELILANKEKEKRADELAIANKELAFQNKEKDKRARELVLANQELAIQNEEKEKRVAELAKTMYEIARQNEEKDKRAKELAKTMFQISYQNEEKEKRANELILANKEKEKRAAELAIANKELAFQNKEKDKRADELILANKEKDKRVKELAIAKELRQFIETSNTPIFGIDKFGLINEWNQASEKVTGYKKEETLGSNWVKYTPDGSENDARKVLSLALKGKQTSSFEFSARAKNGKKIILLVNSSTRRDSAGQITGVLAVGQDITALAKNRAETESIAKELIQFIDTANAPIFGIDTQGQVNEWNQASEKITGYKKSEVLEKGLVQTYITEDYRKSVKKVLDDALLGKETANFEFPLFNKNGKRVMVLLNSSTRRDANGTITGVLGVGQDISEMDNLRTISESIAKELRQFIETANAPIFGIDSEGLVNEWNQTSEKITGFKKDDVFGKDLVRTYITQDYRKSVKKVLDDALLGKETANFEFPLFTKNSERVMVLLNSSTRRDTNGKISGVLGVGQDITELVGYRNELETKVEERTIKLNQALAKQKELNELKSKFVSTASHEFRTPLSAINFAAGSIKKYWGKMDPLIVEKKLHKIEDQVLHMTRLLDDILIVGQAGAGGLRNNPLPVNLGGFIEEIIEEVYTSLEQSHQILLIDPEKLINTDILIDEKLGRNIFINLISNAIKYSPDDKKINIEFSSDKNYIIISVTDFGIGISPSELKTIFTPFSRGKNVDLIQGTGLGLSIAQEAIDAIGGEIIVESTLGSGTSFIVKIQKNY
jgi:PAS domain S-box-containing protein